MDLPQYRLHTAAQLFAGAMSNYFKDKYATPSPFNFLRAFAHPISRAKKQKMRERSRNLLGFHVKDSNVTSEKT
jgi:hypothetical protein